jgi:alkyl sulfatase BDS1-like metallo-beta-lactamase superfamily hydrolase
MADAMEQLGYQAESSTWRNAYLQAVMELRHGVPQLPSMGMAAADMVRAMPLGMFFDYLCMRLDGTKAEGKRLRLNWQFTDTGEQVLLNLENSALTHRQGQQHAQADATVRLARSTLDQISMQRLSFVDAFQAGQIAVDGNGAALMDLMAMIDNFSRMFPIVGPRPDSVRPAT